MADYNNIRNEILEDLKAISQTKANPKVWAIGFLLGLIVSLCYYDSANYVRVRKRIKEIKQQASVSKR
jgi:hypothetical protein